MLKNLSDTLLASSSDYMNLQDRKDLIYKMEMAVNCVTESYNAAEDLSIVYSAAIQNEITSEIYANMNMIRNLKINFNQRLFDAKKNGSGQGIHYFDDLPRHIDPEDIPDTPSVNPNQS